MRLATFRHRERTGVGRVDDGMLVPVRGVASMLELVHAGADGLAAASRPHADAAIPLEAVELLAPIQPPRNVLCVGWNYRHHFDEGVGHRGRHEVEELPDHPTFFTKAPTSVLGPYGSIALHHGLTSLLDWEAELAVVIGTGGVDLDERRALDHVLGYAVANDISARDVQRRHGGQWFKGKSLDLSCPLGPWITTRDEVPDPQELTVTCRVNGVAKQHASTRDMIFSVARIIAELSAGMTLIPGDLILTGTPAGIGSTRTPPERLDAGDVVESEIPSLGVLRNHVVDQERSASDGLR